MKVGPSSKNQVLVDKTFQYQSDTSLLYFLEMNELIHESYNYKN